MSEPAISAGDLVVLTQACCDRFSERPLFVVFSVEPYPCEGPGLYGCNFCQRVLPDSGFATDGPEPSNQIIPLPWLKKIDPLPEEQRLEEITYGI